MKATIIERNWVVEWFDERQCYHMPSLTMADNGDLERRLFAVERGPHGPGRQGLGVRIAPWGTRVVQSGRRGL